MREQLALLTAIVLTASLPAAEPRLEYNRDIRPILSNNCFKCHGPDAKERKAELRLDIREEALKPTETGRDAIVPGKPESSALVMRVFSARPKSVMPPPESNKSLTEAEKQTLKRWIAEGAEYQPHWAFLAPRRPALPEIGNPKSEIRNPIDRFILERLEKEGLAGSPEADRVTLLRRVSLDITGLPPTPQEVEAFVNSRSPDAYEKAVERLLASPAYGERWGRHWLDAARYADSHGFTIDAARVIWPYRDWVINALNRDLPFDQFAIEQLAGDLLLNPTRDQLVATGFHRNTLFNQEGGVDQEQFRIEYVTDRVNTTGTVFLGLTVGCAACHDHKFDPLSQREYYQLFAFFNSCDEPTLELPSPEQERARKQIQARIAELDKQRKVLDRTSAEGLVRWEANLNILAKDKLPPEIQRILDLAPNSRDKKQQEALREIYRQSDMTRHIAASLDFGSPFMRAASMEAYFFRNSVDSRIAELKKSLPDIPSTMILKERKTPRTTTVLLGGDFTRKGSAVARGTPAVLHPLDNAKGPSRLDLARWIADAKNPMTPRVMVNRLWQQYFGVGLVETENDFGTQGTPPSHPELLDWLASEFIARKWSMKEMHRLIVTSATYRQSSKARPELNTLDQRNRLLARQNRLRLDAEVVRDAALSVSGMLARRIGGPSVFPPQPEGVYAFTQLNKDWKVSEGPDRYRRGLYTYFWRSAPHPGLTAFDAPDGNTTCTRRIRSNTPLQALTLLNDQGYFELAGALASRCVKECAGGDRERIAYLFRASLGREPMERERLALERLLGRLGTMDEQFRWTMAARVLLNLDEFITRE